MTDEERAAFIEDLLENTQKYKDRWTEQARIEHPGMTEEQDEWAWKFVEMLFGLPATKPSPGPAKA